MLKGLIKRKTEYGPITKEELAKYQDLYREDQVLTKLMDDLISRHKDLEAVFEQWWEDVRDAYDIEEKVVTLDPETGTITVAKEGGR